MRNALTPWAWGCFRSFAILISGPTPLHLIEKPSPGTGAGLLVDILFWPALGRELVAMAEGRDDDQWRKRLTAKLEQVRLPSSSTICAGGSHSAAVSAAITAMLWEDRVLGSTATLRLPVRCAWVAPRTTLSLERDRSPDCAKSSGRQGRSALASKRISASLLARMGASAS